MARIQEDLMNKWKEKQEHLCTVLSHTAHPPTTMAWSNHPLLCDVLSVVRKLVRGAMKVPPYDERVGYYLLSARKHPEHSSIKQATQRSQTIQNPQTSYLSNETGSLS